MEAMGTEWKRQAAEGNRNGQEWNGTEAQADGADGKG